MNSTNPNSVRIIFGTANFGSLPSNGRSIGPLTTEEAQGFLDVLESFHVSVIDTARSYSNGESEALLKILGASESFSICTKAAGTFNGSGTKEAISQACHASLKALGLETVDLYYLHTPDRITPISETMDAINELYEAGKIKKFGVSNMRADEVLELYNYAISKEYITPVVYQGNYNLLSRNGEKDLFPILRKLGMSFEAYSPLCCGILVDARAKLAARAGRWDTAHIGGKYMYGLYNKPSYINASEELQTLCASRGISAAGTAYRWVAYHSALSKERGDGMVIGASSPNQLRETLMQLEMGPLEQDLVEQLGLLWNIVKEDAPKYFV